jgi:hypothetical protein
MRLSIDITCEPLETIAAELTKLRKIAAHQAQWPLPPNPVGTLEFRQTGDPKMPRLFVTLPQVPADHPESADVVSGELTLVVGDGAEPQVIPTTLGQAEHEIGDVAEETVLGAAFVFIDNAGNKSVTPLVNQYTVADTTPPPDAVDGLGFRVE